MVEVDGGAAANFEEVVVVAGDVMAFRDLLHFYDGAQEGSAISGIGEGHEDEGGERVADGGGIEQRGVAGDDFGFFEFADAIGGGGSGEAEGLAEFGPGGTSLTHQKVQRLSIQGIQADPPSDRWI